MDKRVLYAIPAITVISIFLLANANKNNSGVSDTLETLGKICAWKDSLKEGPNVFIGCSKNTVTNIAKNHTRDIRMGTLANYNGTHWVTQQNISWRYLALTTDSAAPAATDLTCPATIFTTNGCEVAEGTTAEVGSSFGNYSITYKFEATGACNNIAKVCLLNSSDTSAGLFASALLSATVSLAANENLTIVYYIAES